ncbi:uncharacterized protein [Physcomitrium patens]|uniref:DUF7894 domain-containing protein n=1 Tax=Physcomitrium patens TaxID=3218 RepID=A0A2K1JDT0_PHYPA|nr:uncharacterized protein LOC112292060 [Physcomitrium patens]PNR39684.1 hypothetical protein PHYPA_019963 [Physcomitrium patens]|eukprot:XP_024395936.1 uncharacterized protein LOC112292060 [Physcomitrella patens]
MGVAMELGEEVVLLYDGGKVGVTRFSEALVPEASPPLQRVVCNLPWKDPNGEVLTKSEVVNFKDNAGLTKVSLIVFRQEVTSSACGRVVHDLFEYLLSNAPIQSPGFSLVVPAISRMPGSVLNMDTGNNANIYAAFFNRTSEGSGNLDGLPKLPSTFAVRDGFLAYVFHYVHATQLPTLVLVSPSTEGVTAQKNESNEVLLALGDVVGRQIGLTCSKQELNHVTSLIPLASSMEDDWRRLYI